MKDFFATSLVEEPVFESFDFTELAFTNKTNTTVSATCKKGAKKAGEVLNKIKKLSVKKQKAALKKFYKKVLAWNNKNKCPFAKAIAKSQKYEMARLANATKNASKKANKTSKKNHTKKN